jgi:amidase
MTTLPESSPVELTMSGTAMLARLAAGEISAVELVTAHLDRVTGTGAVLEAVVDLDRAGAMAAAGRVDARRSAGVAVGPLAGLPITIKDCLEATGLRTTHGRLLDSRIAPADSPVVRRLRDAGAIIIGKTNVPVFLNDHQSSNTELGVTRNPWDLSRSPGGSSGGASAAVAAGLSVMDLGTDLSGSLRIPATWCGLFGHRASNEIICKLGHRPWPYAALLEPVVSSTGPLTRSAADLSLFLASMIGLEGPDTKAYSLSLPPARHQAIADYRVAVWLDDPACIVDGETRAAIQAFADRLTTHGARVETLTDPPDVGQPALDLFRNLAAGEVVHGFDDEMFQGFLATAATDVDTVGTRFARRVVQTLRDALDDFELQRQSMARWESCFTDFDIVLCPAAPCTAPPLSDVPSEVRMVTIDGIAYPADQIGAWSQISSLGKLPATVVPLGLGAVSGLPIGAQLLGPYLEDHTPLAFAVALEAEGALAFSPPPGW